MCVILLSINPNHVENILNGTKRYEFRKKVCKRHVDKILIYSTTPIMKVVGEAEVEEVLVDNPEAIWKKTKTGPCLLALFYSENVRQLKRSSMDTPSASDKMTSSISVTNRSPFSIRRIK